MHTNVRVLELQHIDLPLPIRHSSNKWIFNSSNLEFS